jgi:hypothetical protein
MKILHYILLSFLLSLVSCRTDKSSLPQVIHELYYMSYNETTNAYDTIMRPESDRITIKFYNDIYYYDVMSVLVGEKERFTSDSKNLSCESMLVEGSSCFVGNYYYKYCWASEKCFYQTSNRSNILISPELLQLINGDSYNLPLECGDYFVFTKPSL